MSASLNINTRKGHLYVGLTKRWAVRFTKHQTGFAEAHVGPVFIGWIKRSAPSLTPEMYAEVLRFGIHPELDADAPCGACRGVWAMDGRPLVCGRCGQSIPQRKRDDS